MDFKDGADRCLKASASLHAVHYGRDFLYPAVSGGVDYDFFLAGVQGREKLSKTRKGNRNSQRGGTRDPQCAYTDECGALQESQRLCGQRQGGDFRGLSSGKAFLPVSGGGVAGNSAGEQGRNCAGRGVGGDR